MIAIAGEFEELAATLDGVPGIAAATGSLGHGLGRLLWWIGGSRKRTALRNLELCFPERPVAERELERARVEVTS